MDGLSKWGKISVVTHPNMMEFHDGRKEESTHTPHTQTKESETMQGMVRRGDGGDYGSEQWGIEY